ncbi:MAG: hypothetical protein JOS17DRAFT_240665 [Linnemannia elongata]|nr:MAG: hypothetical protein JOS17DRAFT_240665 [Linnemannia elongata]
MSGWPTLVLTHIALSFFYLNFCFLLSPCPASVLYNAAFEHFYFNPICPHLGIASILLAYLKYAPLDSTLTFVLFYFLPIHLTTLPFSFPNLRACLSLSNSPVVCPNACKKRNLKQSTSTSTKQIMDHQHRLFSTTNKSSNTHTW